MGDKAEPVSGEEIYPKLELLKSFPSIALAVSGGPDSMALLYLITRWAKDHNLSIPIVRVVSVDHGLRNKSADEAEFVKKQCEACGHHHETLVWHGPKPDTGLQEAARNARYDLILGYCKSHFVPALLTAHHLDDQAETLLMRLARGSGLDGLASMAPCSQWSGLEIVRPLLSYPKQRLIATLSEAGWPWIEDPSNRDVRFERVRWRNNLPALEMLGLSSSGLVKSAQRLGRARKALDYQTDLIARDLIKVYPSGFAEIDLPKYRRLPDEFALRILGRLILAVGGGLRSPQLSKLEEIHGSLMPAAQKKASCVTLGRCQIENDGKFLRFFREVRSTDHSELTINPGEGALWDRRFLVEVSKKATQFVTVRHLTDNHFAKLEISDQIRSALPMRSRAGLVSIWSERHLEAVPQIAYSSSSTVAGRISELYRVTFNNFYQIFGRI